MADGHMCTRPVALLVRWFDAAISLTASLNAQATQALRSCLS